MAANLPRSTVACQAGDWSIRVWKKGTAGESSLVVPFSCLSWRCPGSCARWKGAQDFRRVEDAVKRFDHWMYLVFTFDQAAWPDKEALYRAGVTMWAQLRKRFVRRWGKMRYVQTWERHRKGGAHVNVIISNAEFAEACAGDGWRYVRRQWLRPTALECGFGPVVWLEPLRDKTAMSGYLIKLAQELTGEKPGQTPWDAPYKFRRLRASQDTLPPPIKSEEWTGEMLFISPSAARQRMTPQQTDMK